MTHLNEHHTQPIIDVLDQARQPTGWSRARTFKLWLDIVLATLQRDDEAYQTHVETIERDGDPASIIPTLAHAFSKLFHQTTTTNADVLGATYEHYGLASDTSGQYFTPPNAAALLAGLQTATSAPKTPTPDDPLRIADPTCGSGRLLLTMGRWLARTAPETPVMFAGPCVLV
jgi:type I restriction-modification system DNA methylase subunit